MKSTRVVTMTRNLLVAAGAYYLSEWLGMPLRLGFWKLTQGRTYAGDFNGAVVMPLVSHFPTAIAAAAAGAIVVWLVESDQPLRWAVFPALLYGILDFFGYHWARPPMALDRVAQTVGTLFPAIACVAGGLWAKRRRQILCATDSTPD